MYQAIARFSYTNFEYDPVLLINQLLEVWRYNGQIIGREFSVTYHETEEIREFRANLVLPELNSLSPLHHNQRSIETLDLLQQHGVTLQSVEIIGRDYNAEETSRIFSPTFQLLYTTHLDSCSPVHNGEDFCPIPLYQLNISAELAERIIKWQESWQAFDQLQMNAQQETIMVNEISELNSTLSQQGITLTQQLAQQTGIPTYYYLYRLGQDPNIEYHRLCPGCHCQWQLAEPLHDIFHFKCDRCRLVSNLSWELL